MSEPPKTIFLQWYGDNDDPDFEEPNQVMNEVTWHRDRVFEHDVEYIAASRIEALEAENERATALMHRLEIHPDYEYAKTDGPRKLFDEHSPEGEGWEQNVHRGRDGWERFRYHEEAYWMRLKEVAGE